MLKLLLTGDWQTDLHNLDLCDTALAELLKAIKDYGPDAVVAMGDLKEAYSPVHIPVIQFWVHATKLLSTMLPFYVLLGNHDRNSQSGESRNWLDVIEAAGARVFAEPGVADIRSIKCAFLPYTATEQDALQLYKSCDKSSKRLLFFHNTINGTLLNSGIREKKGLEVYADKYDGAFGGHEHRHQKIGESTYYVGSPFWQDWGEANQSKGHLLVEFDKQLKVKQLKTSIPGWYTSEWLEETGYKPEPGSYIRSKVAVTSKKIVSQLEQEEKTLKERYGDARIFVVPDVRKQEAQEIDLDVPEDERVAKYVSATFPQDALFSAKQAIAYLNSKLHTHKKRVQISALEFDEAEAWNVLCFKHVKVKLNNQGLVLLRGINKDWPGRSIGSGKTSILSLLLVALFGKTMKEQTHDDWLREGAEGEAVAILRTHDSEHKHEIERRRPHHLLLRVDGDDKSIGIRGTGRDETQGLIEKMIGLDWRTTVNSIYIDQSIANGFLFGTQKDRMDLIGKLQDLDLFEAALKDVGKDIIDNEKRHEQAVNDVSRIDIEVDSLEERIRDLAAQSGNVWESKVRQYRKDVSHLHEELITYKNMVGQYDDKQRSLDEFKHDLSSANTHIFELEGRKVYYNKQIRIALKLIEDGCCSNCGQPSSKAGHKTLDESRLRLASLEDKLTKWVDYRSGLLLKIERLQKDIDNYLDVSSRAGIKFDNAKELLEKAQEAASKEASITSKRQDRIDELKSKLIEIQRYLKAAREFIMQLEIDRALLEYSKKAFSRAGMPVYLCAALCPLLNRAADDYSEILTEGMLKIRFAVVDGAFTVDVVNPSGSGEVTGQSTGEAAMAGLICAFALREAAPKTNLLILDEPGHGLDPRGASQFAKGLLKIKDRFSTILITTHSPIIESVLSGEKTWTVVKQNRISKLCL